MSDHNKELAAQLASLKITGNVRIGGQPVAPPAVVAPIPAAPATTQQQRQQKQQPPQPVMPHSVLPGLRINPVVAVPHQPFMNFPGTVTAPNGPRQPHPTYAPHLQIGPQQPLPLNFLAAPQPGAGLAPPPPSYGAAAPTNAAGQTTSNPRGAQAEHGRTAQHHGSRGGRNDSNSRGRGRGGRGGYSERATPAAATDAAAQPASAAAALSPAAPQLPPPPKPKVDEELLSQLMARYAQQDENCDAGMLKPPGLLDVDEALRVVEKNDVTFIVTDTGTGKSTLLPKILMERGNRVVSSQPRRTATINLAMRVAQLRNEPLGTHVGYVLRGDRVGDEKTPLMYMTSYTLFLWIVSHPGDLGFSHFIIDEFHERQPDVEVMLALLKLARLKTKQSFKIILMSASVEVNAWQSYFDGLSVGIYSTCKPRYPVYEYYQEEVCRLVGAAFNPCAVTPVVHSLQLKNALFLIERMLELLAKTGDPSHSILVFLPGRTVVEQMAAHIEARLGSQLEAIPWYRDVELERIGAAFKRTNDTRKKVYLATDIAEVSITLPDVVFVIDSGTTKKPRIDPGIRNSVVFPPLELLWTSKSSVAQRRGRIGRVQQGFYFSMLPETHLPLLVDMEPQIANSRIDELSLHILQIASNPLAVFNLCRQNTKKECVQLSTNILVDTGCALPTNHEQAMQEAIEHPDCALWREPVMSDPANIELRGAAFVTTVKGKIAQRLPLAVNCSLVVANGLLLGLDTVGILVAAIIASGSPFYSMTSDEDSKNAEAKRAQVVKVSDAMAEYAKATPSDILASVVATLEYKIMSSMGQSELAEENWCEARSLSRIRLQNIVKLDAQIKEQLGAVTSFVDVQDAAEVLRGVQAAPRQVTWLAASAFFERAIFVEYDVSEAQRRKKAGRSLFLDFDALCDYQVPSCVVWAKGSIVIPTMLQARYERLFGAFAVRFTPVEFNVLLLLLNYAVYFDPVERRDPPPPGMPPHIVWNPPPYIAFGVELHQRKMVFRVASALAKQVLGFREALGVRTRLQRIMIVANLRLDQDDDIKAAAKERGIPAVSPTDLGGKLGAMLTNIMDQLTGPDAQHLCTPFFGPFAPTKVSMILSASGAIHDFVAPVVLEEPNDAPPAAPAAPAPAAAAM